MQVQVAAHLARRHGARRSRSRPTTCKAEVEKAYSNLQRKAHVKGFRPGKAPRQVLAHLYGPQVANDVVERDRERDAAQGAHREERPARQPAAGRAGQVRSGRRRSRTRRASRCSRRSTRSNYEGFELVRPPVAADEKMVDEQLELLRQQHARLEAPEPARPAQKGDVRHHRLHARRRRREARRTAGGEGVQLELGSGQILPELDAGAHGQEGRRRARRRRPSSRTTHPREELARQDGDLPRQGEGHQAARPARARRRVREGRRQFQTLVELRADMHTRLEKMLKDASEPAVAEQIVDKLNETNPIDGAAVARRAAVPDDGDGARCRTRARMGQRADAGRLPEGPRPVHADAGEEGARRACSWPPSRGSTSIKVTDEDIQKGIEELAAETGKNVAKVRAEYSDPQRAADPHRHDPRGQGARRHRGQGEDHDGDPPAEAASRRPRPTAKARVAGIGAQG